MSQHNAEIDVVKTEDYTPSYLSTSVDFDPQAASFFYESSASTRVATGSTSEHMVVPKSEPSDNSFEAVSIKQMPYFQQTQQMPAREVFVQQRQMQHPQQHQLQYQQHQQFYSHAAQLTPQQREYLLRRGAQVPVHFTVGPSPQTAVHYYSRQLNSQEQHTLTAQGQQQHQQQNIQYSMMPAMVQQQRVQRSAAPVAQRVPIVVRQRHPAATQQQFQYSGQPLGNHLKPGVQYAGGQMYVRYNGEANLTAYNGYQNEVPMVGMNSVAVQQQEGMPVQHLAYSQPPSEYVPESSDYNNNNTNFQGVVKAEPSDEQPSTLDDVLVKLKLKRKRSRKTKALDVNGEGEDVTPPKKKSNKRKRLASEGDGADPAEANATDGPPQPMTHGELLKQKKKNMAFPKGTFLVRYADLDSDEYAGHIWLVDNHQLLQKYTYDGLDASNVKIFSRTERYSGWLCTCPWLYHPLEDVRGSLGNMEKVSVRNHPTRDELLARREEKKKAAELEAERLDVTQDGVNSDGEHSADEADESAEAKVEFKEEEHLIKTEPPDTV